MESPDAAKPAPQATQTRVLSCGGTFVCPIRERRSRQAKTLPLQPPQGSTLGPQDRLAGVGRGWRDHPHPLFVTESPP